MSTASKLRRLAVLALVVAIAIQPAASGAMAASSTPDDPCQIDVGDVFEYVASAGTLAHYDAGKCKVQQQSKDQTHNQIWADSIHSFGQTETVRSVEQNHLNASRDACWCQAKADVLEAMKNGANRSEAKQIANETVDSYYAGVQENIIQSWSNQVNFSWYLIRTADQNGLQIDAGSSSDKEGAVIADDASQTASGYYDFEFIPTESNTVVHNNTTTLLDGNTTTYQWLEVEGQINYKVVDYTDFESQYNDNLWITKPSIGRSYYEPNDASEGQYLLTETEYRDLLKNTKDNHAYVQRNTNALVDGLYDTYNVSDFDNVSASEVHSACSMASFSTDHETTGYYTHGQAALSLMGLNGSVNSSMTVRYNPSDQSGSDWAETVNGIQYADNGTGDGAFVAPSETVSLNVTGVNANVSDVTVRVHSMSGTNLGNISATSSDGFYEFNLSSVNDSIADGERVKLHVDASLDDGNSSTLSNWQLVVDGPTGRSGELLDGALMTDWAPAATNGTYKLDTTYNTSNAGSTVYFMDQRSPNRTVTVEMDGEFVITSMVDLSTGDSVNETTLEDETHVSANGSITLEEVEQIMQWYDSYETNSNSGGGGGSGGFGFGFDFGAASFGFIAIAGAALVLLSNRS